jgi:Asp-tRNA(Asn)/Glu-tRNA(Gln) amidotransferase A subunit family amidase
MIPNSNSTTCGLLRGAGINLQGYAGALSQRDLFIAKMEHFLGDWDAWLCPVAAQPAYPHLQARNPFEQLRATTEEYDCPLDHTIHSDSEDSPMGRGVFSLSIL